MEYHDTCDIIDLTAAARFKAQGFEPQIVPQDDARFVLFRFERSERFNQVAADLASGMISENPFDIEKARRQLRTSAIIANAAKRGGA